MAGVMENENGNISVSLDVIAKYAGHAALDCFGIVGMAAISMRDGLAKLLNRDSVGRGVNVKINDDNTLTIDFHVIVAYGVNIKTVADNLVDTVKYHIEDYTTMKVRAINIFVEGVRVID